MYLKLRVKGQEEYRLTTWNIFKRSSAVAFSHKLLVLCTSLSLGLTAVKLGCCSLFRHLVSAAIINSGRFGLCKVRGNTCSVVQKVHGHSNYTHIRQSVHFFKIHVTELLGWCIS